MNATVRDLPALNAVLNGSSAAALAAGYAMIRGGRVAAHRFCMLSAFALSSLFLASYLFYHYNAGAVRYHGPGRPAYLFLLASHTSLAAVNVPLILRTLFLAARGRFEEHRRLARWTLASWMYVSITGVAIYRVLYI